MSQRRQGQWCIVEKFRQPASSCNSTNTQLLVIVDQATRKDRVTISDCHGCRVRVTQKVGKLMIEGCRDVVVETPGAVADVEIVNSDRIQVKVTYKVPVITVDRSNDIELHVPETCLTARDFALLTSRTSNVVIVPQQSNCCFPLTRQMEVPTQWMSIMEDDTYTTSSQPVAVIPHGALSMFTNTLISHSMALALLDRLGTDSPLHVMCGDIFQWISESLVDGCWSQSSSSAASSLSVIPTQWCTGEFQRVLGKFWVLANTTTAGTVTMGSTTTTPPTTPRTSRRQSVREDQSCVVVCDCQNAKIVVPTNVRSITLSNCKKVKLVCERSVLQSCEFVGCQEVECTFQAHVTALAVSHSADISFTFREKGHHTKVFNQGSVNVGIKCQRPRRIGSGLESFQVAIPEQFRTIAVGGLWYTQPV